MIWYSRYLLSLMLLVFLVHLCDGWFIEKKVHLKITNDLGNDSLVLHLHCKSKDDDLGEQALAPHQFFEFSFRPNFFLTTLYYCEFWWGNGSHWFDIYVALRDTDRCNDKCWWMVHKDGPCLLNPTVQRYTLCQDWNTDKFEALTHTGIGNNTARMINDSEYLEGHEKRGK